MTSRISAGESLLIACLMLLSLLAAFPAVMTTLAPYDDQGYVMITLKSFLDGQTLYEDIHTQYGPAFYLLSGSLHETMGIPLTQDGVRLKTVAFWCVATLLVFSILRRLGTNSAVAFLASGLFHLHLYKLALEPGHPQEWILVLSLLSFWFLVGENRLKWFFAATLVGFIGMTKINCGVIFAIPLVAQSLFASKHHWHAKSPLVMVLAGGASSALAVVGITMALGVSLQQIAWGLLGQHRRFSSEFFHIIPISPFSICFGVACLWGIYKMRLSQRSSTSRESSDHSEWQLLRIGFVVTSVLIGAYHVVEDWTTPLLHGLEPRGAANWLVLLGPITCLWLLTMDTPARRYFPYILLTTLLSPLMAYPTPGTQISLGTAPSWIVLGIVASACIQSSVLRTVPNVRPIPDRGAYANRSGLLGLIPLTIIFLVVSAGLSWNRWLSYSPLALRGSQLLRLDPQRVDKEVQIAQAIDRTGCEHLVFDGHNHNRFFFWTSTEPLTAANPTFWPRMITEPEQKRILAALRENGDVCMVVPPESDQLASDQTKLVREALYQSWEEIERVNDWRIGIIRSP
ncbi:MAG: hypothetical protein MUC43_00725 [Pirellula sp.]|jgi:hypothetical protein|nr:hypothetical protein [Pirellula sp.]